MDETMLVRAGLRAVIESDAALRVAGEAPDGERALRSAERLRPALVVIGGLSGRLTPVDLSARLHAAHPATPIVVLGRLDDGETLVASLRAGATGILRIGIERHELLNALWRAVSGETVVDPALATALVTRMASESDFSGRSLPDGLTPREVEILRLVAQGQTNREIAGRLILAVGTIKAHVGHILDKLGVHDRTQAAVRAVELGIAVPDDPDPRADPRHRAA